MATYSSTLAWRIPWTEEWWASVCRVAQRQTGLIGLSTHIKLKSHMKQHSEALHFTRFPITFFFFFNFWLGLHCSTWAFPSCSAALQHVGS